MRVADRQDARTELKGGAEDRADQPGSDRDRRPRRRQNHPGELDPADSSGQEGGVSAAGPTGRAAKWLTERAGPEAKTIHRLPEIRPATGMFRHNKDKMLECGLLVVDETSMSTCS